MKAGVTLDALVDEKIFGHAVSWRNNFAWRTDIISEIRARSRGFDLITESRIAGAWVPQYSTDIAAAWNVVERLINTGHQVEVNGCKDEGDPDGDPWVVLVGLSVGHAQTAPLAICISALEAVA